MKELKERIVKEGTVLPGNIAQVDGFPNHRIAPVLTEHIAVEFGLRFDMDAVAPILTAESGGDRPRAEGVNLPSLAVIERAKPGNIVFRDAPNIS